MQYPSVGEHVFARWLSVFVSWSSYISLQQTPQWAVLCVVVGFFFWMELCRTNWQLRAHRQAQKYMCAHCWTTHTHTYKKWNTRGSHTLADGLNGSLFSGLKRTEGSESTCLSVLRSMTNSKRETQNKEGYGHTDIAVGHPPSAAAELAQIFHSFHPGSLALMQYVIGSIVVLNSFLSDNWTSDSWATVWDGEKKENVSQSSTQCESMVKERATVMTSFKGESLNRSLLWQKHD